MIKGLSDAGRVKDALNFLSEMSEKGLVPDAYCHNAVIKGLCDLGLWMKLDLFTVKFRSKIASLMPALTPFSFVVCAGRGW